ncbi:MAG TPA: hypothetical protein VE553_03800 [Candidatus Binatia bacterium]|nr:hypothetical protein [Candidatus Binatia bacterium]
MSRSALPVAPWRAVWLAAALAFAIVARNALTTPQFQARFLFPALGPLATIAVVGYWSVLPRRREALLTPNLAGGLALLNVYFWLSTIIPHFFQSFLDG